MTYASWFEQSVIAFPLCFAGAYLVKIQTGARLERTLALQRRPHFAPEEHVTHSWRVTARATTRSGNV
jgi:hypothetical protein